MKESLPSLRTSSTLSKACYERLNAYALAASAAGVGVLALGQPSEAKIVYTPTSVTIVGPNGIYNLDLNNDGQIDFTIRNRKSRGSSSYSYILSQQAAHGNGAECSQGHGGPGYALALKRGSRVGSRRRFCQTDGLEYVFGSGSRFYFGDWKNATNRYLGLKFKIKGQTHYGWARLSVSFKNGLRAILTGYAYETIPNKPIIAGKTHGTDGVFLAESTTAMDTLEPATLGALAAGSPALPVWRRGESR